MASSARLPPECRDVFVFHRFAELSLEQIAEHQSRDNAKHTLRAMNENARQGFWNGANRTGSENKWRTRQDSNL